LQHDVVAFAVLVGNPPLRRATPAASIIEFPWAIAGCL
jgi:hypothetical protein